MHLGAQEEEEEGGEEEEEEGGDTPFIQRRPVVIPPGIDCRRIDINEEDPEKRLISCAMGMGGRVVVGVGSKGSLWVWRYDD
jgi:polycomb protein EED